MCGPGYFFSIRRSVIEGELEERAGMGAFEPPSIVPALWESYLCPQHTHTGRLSCGARAGWTRADLAAPSSGCYCRWGGGAGCWLSTATRTVEIPHPVTVLHSQRTLGFCQPDAHSPWSRRGESSLYALMWRKTPMFSGQGSITSAGWVLVYCLLIVNIVHLHTMHIAHWRSKFNHFNDSVKNKLAVHIDSQMHLRNMDLVMD